MARQIKAGTLDVSVVLRIVDSVDGTPETGVVAAGVSLEYRRELSASVPITESNLAALTTAHTDGGMIHLGAGYYRLDLPDAACATGQRGVLVHGTGSGLVIIGEYIDLVAYDPYDGANLGLSTLSSTATLAEMNAQMDLAIADAQIANAVSDKVIETQGSIKLREALSIILAAVAGRTTTGGLVFQSPNGGATRITATVDASNNRTNIVISPSA